MFEYLADIERLPEWATEFARELKRERHDYKVVNRLGEFYFEIRADRDTGVIDMFAGPSKDEMAIFPTRGRPARRPHGVYLHDVPGPDMPDERFESQHESLKREFANIAAVFAD